MSLFMERLREFLRAEFDISEAMLVKFEPVSHNTHVLASVSDKTYHLTLRDLRFTEDTPEVIERILSWCTALTGSTARIARTQVRSRSGTFLVPFDDLYLSVRQHLGTACERSVPISMAVDCATEHGRAIDMMAGSIGLARNGLRYRPMLESLALIRERLTTFVAFHATDVELKALMSTLNDIAAAAAASRLSRLVHGDLSFTNLIEVDGAVSVIDHDCLHLDHPLYDHAHLLVSMASSEYFHGTFSDSMAEGYIDNWYSGIVKGSREDLIVACEYVVLKKLALVQQPRNLHLCDRLDALRLLRTLRD